MRRGIMRRLLLAAAVLACVLLWLPAVASAAADDIPGTPMNVGATVTSVLDDVTKKYDVYSVNLTSGEQIQIQATDTTKNGYVGVDLIAPGATSIRNSYSTLGYTSSGGTGPLVYTPAKDGVYFLLVRASGKGVVYTLTLSRTGTPAVIAPDSNDIFGLPIGLGSVIGIVDDVTDKYDVYAVSLFAREQVQIQATDTTKNGYVGVDLIAPGATSIRNSYSTLGYTSSGGTGPLVYTPAKDGVYFLLVRASGKGVVYTLTISGSAEKPPYPSLLTLRSSATQVKKGRSVTLSATLVTPNGVLVEGQSISLQRSFDGKSWSTIKSLSSSSGRYSSKVTITRSSWFRMKFAGDADHGACTSRKLLIKAK
jgi:hypothetical protein